MELVSHTKLEQVSSHSSSGHFLLKKGPSSELLNILKREKIKHSGLTIHYVIREVDRGEPIITQEV